MSDAMSDTIHERIGKAEQEIHTLKHQVSKLDLLPPRVSDLERAFEGIQYLRADQADIKLSIKTVSDAQVKMVGDIEGFSRALKWVGGMMSLAAIVTGVVVWLAANS